MSSLKDNKIKILLARRKKSRMLRMITIAITMKVIKLGNIN